MNPIPTIRTAGIHFTDVAGKLLLIGLGLLAVGCNNSRYGVRYDQRLPEIKQVAVIPASIEVSSMHSGGVQEARLDLVEPARDRVIESLISELKKRGVEATRIESTTATPGGDEASARAFALAKAVSNSIQIHHYLFGKEEIFDYSTGTLPRLALMNQNADAVLLVYLTSFVPTEGRKALQATAIVVGVLTGVHVYVATCGASATLVLIDARNGDVLWFNQLQEECDIRKNKTVERLLHKASRYLLKPRK
ncbi:MAG: hypothetical protein HZA51_09135 [Planctomycetes bacterium]|nr:hypothetical protein [Planctomycetota bacterium]